MASGSELSARWVADLDRAFDDAVAGPRGGTAPLGVLFSGGVDSGLLAWELRNRPGVTLYTLGSDGSADLRSGRQGAELIGLPWERLPANNQTVTEAEARFSEELEGTTAIARTVLLSLAVAINACPRDQLLCGQGVDELFLGYAHYRGLSVADLERRSRADLAQLLESDWPRTQRIAGRVGKTIRAPYLSTDFREAALRTPVDLRLPGHRPKEFFRDWARHRGLPEELAARPKKALQYGSGVDALIRRRRRALR